MLPHVLSPWPEVYQQTRRWIKAGCLEVMAHDLRILLRFNDERQGQPRAKVIDSRTLQFTPGSGHDSGYAWCQYGFVLLPRHWVLERGFAWAARFRQLARDYERLALALAGFHFLACACLMLNKFLNITSLLQTQEG